MSSDEDLAYLGVAQAQALFRARKLSPVELVEALIRRTEALDPLIHAFVTTTPELALVRARQAEQRFMRGDADAFTGIPYGLKDILATTGALAKSGAVRMLGISSEKWSELFPNVPTVAESLPGFAGGRLVRTLRPGGHEELTERINRDIHKVVGSADMKELMQANGQSAALSTPVAFTEFLRVDSARTSDYIKQVGIKPQ
jgi:hypothetical protein